MKFPCLSFDPRASRKKLQKNYKRVTYLTIPVGQALSPANRFFHSFSDSEVKPCVIIRLGTHGIHNPVSPFSDHFFISRCDPDRLRRVAPVSLRHLGAYGTQPRLSLFSRRPLAGRRGFAAYCERSNLARQQIHVAGSRARALGYTEGPLLDPQRKPLRAAFQSGRDGIAHLRRRSPFRAGW